MEESKGAEDRPLITGSRTAPRLTLDFLLPPMVIPRLSPMVKEIATRLPCVRTTSLHFFRNDEVFMVEVLERRFKRSRPHTWPRTWPRRKFQVVSMFLLMSTRTNATTVFMMKRLFVRSC